MMLLLQLVVRVTRRWFLQAGGGLKSEFGESVALRSKYVLMNAAL